MIANPQNILNYIQVFMLVLIRVSAIFIISPIFGRKQIPSLFKIGLSFIIALIITPLINFDQIEKYNDIFSYCGIVLLEFITGLIIGFIAYIIFSSLYIAGQLIDMQIGFGMVSILDPNSNIQLPVMANFYSMIALTIFLIADGHHMIISSLFYSYKVIPIGQSIIDEAVLRNFVLIFSDVFALGFKIAMPVIATILITDIGLGILSKSAPQMNVFVVGMPIKIFIGIVIVVISMPMFGVVVNQMINMMYNDIDIIIRGMVK